MGFFRNSGTELVMIYQESKGEHESRPWFVKDPNRNKIQEIHGYLYFYARIKQFFSGGSSSLTDLKALISGLDTNPINTDDMVNSLKNNS